MRIEEGSQRIATVTLWFGLWFTLAAMAGCSAPHPTASEPAATPDRADPEMLERRREQLEHKVPKRAPGPSTTVTGEVPAEVMDTVMLALEKLTGSEREAFEVLRAEETIWPDGALGCPQPGMIYTQATVPGFHVVLKHADREYDYRIGGTRYLLLCVGPGAATPPGAVAPTR